MTFTCGWSFQPVEQARRFGSAWSRSSGEYGLINQPTVQTLRLALLPAGPGDLQALHALWSQAEVRRFLFDDQDVSMELAASVLAACLECATSGYGLWLMYRKDDGVFLGCAGLTPAATVAEHEPALAGLLEVLVALEPAHWHRGYAHEALSAVLSHAFGTLDLPKVAAVNDVPNVASGRMLDALGFRMHSEVEGPRHRLRTYLMERNSWAGRNDA
jgi:RimJ/RimL family protein N-acetyltransferase